MFEFIGKLLTNIANFFTSVWDFIINLISEIVYIVKLLAQVVAEIPTYFGWMPTAVLSLFLVLIGIVVIYKVAGRSD